MGYSEIPELSRRVSLEKNVFSAAQRRSTAQRNANGINEDGTAAPRRLTNFVRPPLASAGRRVILRKMPTALEDRLLDPVESADVGDDDFAAVQGGGRGVGIGARARDANMAERREPTIEERGLFFPLLFYSIVVPRRECSVFC